MNEVEVAEPVETTALTLVEHHPVFVDGSVRANEEDDVAWVELLARLAIEVTIDHCSLVSDEALVEHLLVLEFFGWVLRQHDDLEVQVLELWLEFTQLMRRLLL